MAEYGAWFWDESGDEDFGVKKQTVKFMGVLSIGGVGSPTSGSITDARFTAYSGHEGFWAPIELSSGSAIYNRAVWSLSGNTLSWAFPSGVTPSPEKVMYGIIGKR